MFRIDLKKVSEEEGVLKERGGGKGGCYIAGNMTHLLCFPPYIKPRLEFHNQYFSFPTVGLACTGMSNLYFNLFPKLYGLYLSCCSHRPALTYIYIYIYGTYTRDIQIQACDRHKNYASLFTKTGNM